MVKNSIYQQEKSLNKLIPCQKNSNDDCKECFKFKGKNATVFSANHSLKKNPTDPVSMCDCIVFCYKQNVYFCVEVTDGKLNFEQANTKLKQVESCYMHLKSLFNQDCIKMIVHGGISVKPPGLMQRIQKESNERNIFLVEGKNMKKLCK